MENYKSTNVENCINILGPDGQMIQYAVAPEAPSLSDFSVPVDFGFDAPDVTDQFPRAGRVFADLDPNTSSPRKSSSKRTLSPLLPDSPKRRKLEPKGKQPSQLWGDSVAVEEMSEGEWEDRKASSEKAVRGHIDNRIEEGVKAMKARKAKARSEKGKEKAKEKAEAKKQKKEKSG